jgi:hypothetical protein
LHKTLIELHNEKIAALTPEQFEEWNERAAIKEFCGRIPRTLAEVQALMEIMGRK